MKGHVSKRGSSWAYWFDIDPDPLTGKRRQQTKSGYRSEKEAWKACRAAIADYEKGRLVRPSRRKVKDAMAEWLARIEHSIKPSMAQNWRNYSAYYVEPYIGDRALQEINGAICDALYAKLLAEGRLKARPAKRDRAEQPVHVRRVTRDGRVLPCRPYRYDDIRCYRTHAADDAVLGQPIIARKPSPKAAQRRDTGAHWLPPGLEPKTVVNTHRMLHRAWEDFVAWGWAKRNVISDAHPPRLIRKGRRVWTVDQLRTFLQRARSDRFFALWVLEATSGMRRGELTGARRDVLDLEAGTLTTETTRIVITRRFYKLTAAAGLPRINLHDVRHSYATAGRNARIDWKALSARIGHADVAFTMKQYVQADREADRQVANILAELIIGGSLTSVDVTNETGGTGAGTAA